MDAPQKINELLSGRAKLESFLRAPGHSLFSHFQEKDLSDLTDILINDQDLFCVFLYTPWKEALKELEQRQDDVNVLAHIDEFKNVIPSALLEGQNISFARNLLTPNYETHRFIHFLDVLGGKVNPVVLEYKNDKYVNVNSLKYALAELSFHQGVRGEKTITDKISIINRNESNGQKISEVQTKFKCPLPDFHEQFFNHAFPNANINKIDLSEMYFQLGGRASGYYEVFLSIFLKNSILFEDFTFSKNEIQFTKSVVLPAFFNILRKTGKKPLVISIGPKGNETDNFWTSYPSHLKEFVEKQLPSKNV